MALSVVRAMQRHVRGSNVDRTRPDHRKDSAIDPYANDLSDIFRRVAFQITVILKGTSPQDIPVYEPTKFELVVNIKTAKSLGSNVPLSIIVSASGVIE